MVSEDSKCKLYTYLLESYLSRERTVTSLYTVTSQKTIGRLLNVDIPSHRAIWLHPLSMAMRMMRFYFCYVHTQANNFLLVTP